MIRVNDVRMLCFAEQEYLNQTNRGKVQGQSKFCCCLFGMCVEKVQGNPWWCLCLA